MPTSALDIAQAVVDELGLSPIQFLTNNTSTDARQVLALMNRAGDQLYQDHPWIVSQAEHIVEIGTPITTTGDVTVSNDTIINIPSTAGIVANQFAVIGNNLTTSTRVLEVVSGTSVRVDQVPLATEVGAQLIFARDTYAVPDAFKWFADRTMWDRTNYWELIGPMSPQADQWERSGIVTTGPRRRWRQIGSEPVNWRIWPPPTASGDYPATLVFEYNSKNWARSTLGVPIAKITLDTDYPAIDAQAMVLSIKWRYWQVKGFSGWGAMQAEANDYIDRLAARDGGAADLSLARPGRSPFLITPDSVPDGSWPGPGNP